jgi:hypothetical protein
VTTSGGSRLFRFSFPWQYSCNRSEITREVVDRCARLGFVAESDDIQSIVVDMGAWRGSVVRDGASSVMVTVTAEVWA